MFRLLELEPGQCKYALTPCSPHFFCGEPARADSVYCAAHHRICYDTRSPKNWQSLAGMIDVVETTVQRVRPRPEPKHEALDQALRCAETYFDEECGLMRRT